MSRTNSEYPPTALDDNFAFGKHQGEKVWKIIEDEPEYIQWLIQEADMDFHLTDDAWEKYKRNLADAE